VDLALARFRQAPDVAPELRDISNGCGFRWIADEIMNAFEYRPQLR
jgi:hypothetical protein